MGNVAPRTGALQAQLSVVEVPVYLATRSGNRYRIAPLGDGRVAVDSINSIEQRHRPLYGPVTGVVIDDQGRLEFADDSGTLTTSPIIDLDAGVESDLGVAFEQAAFDWLAHHEPTFYVECEPRNGEGPNNIYAFTTLDADARATAREGATHRLVSLLGYERGARDAARETDSVGLLGLGRPLVIGRFSKSFQVDLTGKVLAYEGETGPRRLAAQFNERVAAATRALLGMSSAPLAGPEFGRGHSRR